MIESTMSSQIKRLIVDDHPALRDGIRQAMGARQNLIVAGEAATGALALKLADELQPDLIVMDVHLPDLNGLGVSRQVLSIHPLMKIVIFSSDLARATIDQALQAGVCGYLSKNCPVDELIQAIDAVMAGKLYLSADVSTNIVNEYRKGLVGELVPAKESLSEREKQMLQLIAEGRRNKEIAVQLAISVKSVEANRSRLMKKLDCSSAAELVRYAVREGLAEA